MAESESSLPANCRQRLDDHLDAIELALLRTNATRESRRSVIDMVESQVIEMCRTKLNEESTDEAVGELFEQLDPPELYAEGFEQHAAEAVPQRKAKQKSGMSHLAVVSVVLLAIPFPFFIAALAFGEEWLIILFYMLSFVAVIGAPILSWLSLREINRSKGRITGRSLALVSLYVVPLIIANCLLVGIGLILEVLSIVICIAATMGIINAGVLWLIRHSVDRWCLSDSKVTAPQNDIPIAAGTVAS